MVNFFSEVIEVMLKKNDLKIILEIRCSLINCKDYRVICINMSYLDGYFEESSFFFLMQIEELEQIIIIEFNMLSKKFYSKDFNFLVSIQRNLEGNIQLNEVSYNAFFIERKFFVSLMLEDQISFVNEVLRFKKNIVQLLLSLEFDYRFGLEKVVQIL